MFDDDEDDEDDESDDEDDVAVKEDQNDDDVKITSLPSNPIGQLQVRFPLMTSAAQTRHTLFPGVRLTNPDGHGRHGRSPPSP